MPAPGFRCLRVTANRAAALSTVAWAALLLPTHAAAAPERQVHIVRFVEPALAPYLAARAQGAAFEHTAQKSAPAIAHLERLAERREVRLERASKQLGRRLDPLFVYDKVLNAVALELSAEEARQLASEDGVAAVEPERIDFPQDEAATNWVHAPEVWSGVAGVASRGEGVVIGVIDTGIHPGHPSFAAVAALDGHAHVNPRGRFFGLCVLGLATCNNKLIGVWDFTSGSASTEPDNGLDVDGHGSHVAASAAGNAVRISRILPGGGSFQATIRGVAPRAHLISYKACEGGEVGCPSSWTLAALNQAVGDGVEVINYSIGGSNRNPWTDSVALAMRDARSAGIVVVVAAGNRGPDVGTVTSPSDAPWVLAVANASHGRRFINRLRLSGGDSPPPGGGVLLGDGLTGGVGPVPIVRDPAAPLCSQGEGDQTLPPTGASNPWPSGRWRGEIVVCDRGIHARVAKSNNVRLSDGGGMVLLNRAVEGESTIADAHSLPSTHLGFQVGQQLLQWMGSGGGHSARLDGVAVEVDPGSADILNVSSGRGPSSAVPSVLKPDLAAPGTDIQSAAHQGSGEATLSGTSMAAPQVAGAAALLRSAHPGWRADQIISAISGTARPSIRREDRSSVATSVEQGAGMLDVSRAIRAALAFPVDPVQFHAGLAAATAINLPSLVFDACSPDCASLTRSVADLAGGGQWAVEVQTPPGVTLTVDTPQFNLAAGARRNLLFSARVDDPGLYGRWLDAAVLLRRLTPDGRPDLRLPVRLLAPVVGLSGGLSRTVSPDRGAFDTVLPGINLPMPSARFAGTALVAPVAHRYTLDPDPTPLSRFDNLSEGVGWHTITVPAPASGRATRYRIEIELQTPSGTQSSLLAGNGAMPGSRSLFCESAGRCQLVVEHPGSGGARSYWAMVWNRSGSGQFIVTHTVLALTPAEGEGPRLVATGPGSALSGQTSNVRIGWSDPRWPQGEFRRGALLLYAAASDQPMADLPIVLLRGANEVAPVLLASGVEQNVPLPSSAAHERVFIDVPAGTQRLEVSSSGPVAHRLYLAHRPILAPSSVLPSIQPAPPRAEARVSTPSSASAQQLLVEQPAAGRWYVTPVNTGALSAALAVRASLIGHRPTIRSGSWFNPERSGAGLFLHPAGDDWAGLWYTYFEDGSPTWYYLQGPAPATHGQWHGRVFRSAWDGVRNHLTAVGAATVTPGNGDELVFSFTLDGASGSETLRPFGRGCPSVDGRIFDASTHWFDPIRAGSGFSVQAMQWPAAYEFYAAFLYDSRGMPRFLIAEGPASTVASVTFPLQQLQGFCPLCTRPPAGPVRSAAGEFRRSVGSDGLATLQVDASWNTWVTNVPGRWQVIDQIRPLDPNRRTQGCLP